MEKRLIISAYNTHSGGGKTLLLQFLKQEIVINEIAVILIDKRLENELSDLDIKKIVVKPTIINRFIAEWHIFLRGKKESILFCFGNLPPLFASKGSVTVFLQNRYLVKSSKSSGLPIKTRLRICFESLWLKMFANNADCFIVQTPTMKRLLQCTIGEKHKIKTEAFYAKTMIEQKTTPINVVSAKHDFIYVASGESHKNHHNLIEAFCLLSKENIFPSLCLTINPSSFSGLCSWIKKNVENHQLNVKNLGMLQHESLLKQYKLSKALIFPSQFESFGIPLVEAKAAGIAVLAPELDYVRDILDPTETFDPESPISIARAIKRFLKVGDSFEKVLSPYEFACRIIS